MEEALFKILWEASVVLEAFEGLLKFCLKRFDSYPRSYPKQKRAQQALKTKYIITKWGEATI